MRWVLFIWVALAGGVARGEDIVQVLERSQQVRMDKLQAAPADSARAQKVRASFETLRGRLGLGLKVELRVVRGDVLAEALHGDVVIVNEAIGGWPEQERLFVLAHELGHVALGHWSQMSGMYQKWVPGRVTQEQTDAVASLLGREASALAYQHEYEADAFAARALEALGISQQEVFSIFMRLGSRKDTATHPGTQRRLASLRAGVIKLPPAP
jgi:predicted Zn-dependent protease